MQSRIYYLYLRLLVKIQLFFQAIFGFISSSHKNDHKSDVKQSLVSIYLGNKVFSNYSIRPGDDVSFINISALKNRRFDDSIFILSNNDFSNESSFLVVSEIKKNSSNLQVLIWDFDNHHSLVNSMRLLYLSDFYFAAHLHNFEFLRRASSSYFGFLLKAVDFAAIQIQSAKTTRWNGRREGSFDFLRLVEGNQFGDVDVSHAIAVGKTKSFFIFDIVRHTLQATTGHGVFTSIHQCDAPRLSIALMHFHAVGPHIESDIGHVQKVVGKVLFDDVTLVSTADNKFVDAMVRVCLQDVPQNGLAANLNHWFGTGCGVFTKACA